MRNKLYEIVKPIYVRIALYLMIFSYFYNLPVLHYSLKGSNEFRLYDVVGLIILYIYLKHFRFINYFTQNLKYFKALKQFMLWCLITMILTFAYHIVLGSIFSLIQTLLYFYHFSVFYLTAVLITILITNSKEYKKILHYIFLLTIISSTTVILQNLGAVPFLWSRLYAIAYDGFLSGTFGPNKIVLGMSMFMSFTLSFAFYSQKHIKLNKILVLGSLIMSLSTLLISGSRTSYLALIIFMIYMLITGIGKFIKFSFLAGIFITVILSFNLRIVTIITDVFNKRITNKISNTFFINNDFEGGSFLENELATADLLYEDLGSGRKGLSLAYIEFLLDTPLIIPFGMGFNNRALIGFSAHNIYLTLIAEVGIVGSFLYFRWLFSYLFIKFGKWKHFKSILKGLVLSMLITLLFGEHLYIYRPLFGILGLFLLITVLLLAPKYYSKNERQL